MSILSPRVSNVLLGGESLVNLMLRDIVMKIVFKLVQSERTPK